MHTERFCAQVAAAPKEITAGTVRFSTSKVEAKSDGMINLVRLAEDHGLNPAHGCRMGICHGCTVKLKSGQVRDLRDGRVYGEEDDLIQICVCAPAGDVAIEL